MSEQAFEHWRLGDLFDQRVEAGIADFPTFSVTLRDGLVLRDDLERKTDTSLEHNQHLLVREGDIAYNMMRMWQGASGRAPTDGIVSPAYVVLQPKGNVDSRFAAHWFKSARLIHLFWAYSHGLTEDRLRLYFDAFAEIPVTLPSIAQQRRIAAILDEWDRAIAGATRAVELKHKRRVSLISRLIDNKRDRITELDNFCSLSNQRMLLNEKPSHWKCIELEDIPADTGTLLDTNGHRGGVGTRNVFKKGDVLFGKLRPYLNKYYLAEGAGVASTEFWVLRSDATKCLPEYLSLLTQSRNFKAAANRPTGSKMPRAEWELVREAPLYLPELVEQAEITRIISSEVESITALSKGADLLRLQKRGLMQKLLSGDWPVPASIDRLLPGGQDIDEVVGAVVQRAEATG